MTAERFADGKVSGTDVACFVKRIRVLLPIHGGRRGILQNGGMHTGASHDG